MFRNLPDRLEMELQALVPAKVRVGVTITGII